MKKYKTLTKNSYNENVEKHVDNYKKQANFEKRNEFSTFIKNLKGKKILDVGCGPGFHVQYFNEQKFNAIGIDISEEMIKKGKEFNIPVFLMDLENISFENNSFDGIWVMSALFHIPKSHTPNVINKFYDLLRGKGLFAVSLKNGDEEKFDNNNRFFAYWKKEEFLSLTKNLFENIWYEETVVNDQKYINFIFRKK